MADKFMTKDSGEREVFGTGAQRDTREGKGRFDLLPPGPVKRLAQLYERGAKKYDDNNWKKGMPFSRFMDSLIRHAFQYLEGDRSEDHLAAVSWNAFAIMHLEEKRPDLDDLTPKPETEWRPGVVE